MLALLVSDRGVVRSLVSALGADLAIHEEARGLQAEQVGPTSPPGAGLGTGSMAHRSRRMRFIACSTSLSMRAMRLALGPPGSPLYPDSDKS